LQRYNVDQHEPLSLDQSSIKEFEDLNRSLEGLAQRARDVYFSQKAFTENASHEMQSPLAVFQSKLELLMQTAPLTPEQARLINDLADAGRRMSRLNKSLVLLTKIENNQFSNVESISLQHIVAALMQQYEMQIKEKDLQVHFEHNGDVVVNADKALIEMLAGNLLANAIRHNFPGGKIRITLQNNSLLVCNSGVKTPLDNQKIFDRFVKGNTDSNGTGLGLSIASTICRICNYTLHYSYAGNMHCFSVEFGKGE